MKFKLFQRLRSDGGTDSSSTDSPPAQQGFGEPEMDQETQTGGSLERMVENMFQQGYAEEEIMQELQGQYSEQEIQRAVNQTVKNNAAPSDGPQAMQPYQTEDEPVSPVDEGYGGEGQQPAENNPDPQQTPQQPSPQQQPQQQQQMDPLPQPGEGDEGDTGPVDQRVEELIETIVAENFNRVRQEFENVYSELDLLEEEIEDLDQRVHDLEIRDDEDQQEFVEKVTEMEEHIDSYQSRIGGLEKAFQQVLPNLVNNVRDLTSLVQEIKQEKGIQTETNVSEQEMEEMDEELQDW